MNLANVIRQMGQSLVEKKDAPPFDVSKADYAGAAKELTQYAKKSGGVDKNDFLGFANRMSAIASKKSPRVTSKFARDLQDLDTDVREVVIRIMRNNGIKVTMAGGGLKIEDFDIEQLETMELEEAKVQGREVFDKTFANRTQADNFAKKNGGRVKQVGRVFYVFKEAKEDDEPASPDEGSMAMQQLEFIEYAAEKLSDHIKDGGDFPEWMQNKLATVNDQMQSLYSQIDQDGSDQMDEAYKTPAEAKAYEDGKKAVAKKVSYDDNPNKKGTKEYTAWSKGHNDARAKLIAKRHVREDVELEESPMVSMTIPNVTSDMASKLERLAKENDVEYSRKGRTVVLKGKRMDMTSIRTKMGISQTNLKMVPVNEELEEAKRNPSKSGGSGYDLYHKDFSTAMAHAYKYAKDKLGIEIDPKEIDDKVASGPRKPSKGKTNSYRLMGKDGKKGVQIQVANLDDKKYELNMYKESVEMELDENAGLIKDYQDMKAQGKKDHNILDVLMSMPKYKRMSKDQMAKIIGDAKRKGIFKEEVEMELNEAREDTATQVARALKKMGVKPNAKEADIIKKIPDVLKKMGLGDNKLIKRDPDFIGDVLDSMNEEVNLDELFESAFEEEKLSLEDTLKAIWEGKKLDPVNKKALKKDFDDRKDKDLDNDGDVDDSDEYMHNKRKAIGKAMSKDSDEAEADQEKEVSKKEDEPKKKVGKSEKQTKVDVNPSIDEEKGEEMTSAEMEKKDEIMKSLEKKKDEFVKKYGDRAKEVMARTAIKMAKKHA